MKRKADIILIITFLTTTVSQSLWNDWGIGIAVGAGLVIGEIVAYALRKVEKEQKS